ncbi:MAG: ABC transporter permease, partial [Phycisphaerae bacterium]
IRGRSMGIQSYVMRRIMLMIPMFFLSTIVIFSLIHVAPGDPIEIMFTESGRPPAREVIEELRKSLGLDKPIYVQYFIWINKLLHGDFGIAHSTAYIGQPVLDLIKSRFRNTITLMFTAQMMSLLIGIVLGVFAAIKQYSIFDTLSSIIALFGYSMPNFWLALMLVFIFALGLGWFPIFGTHEIGSDLTGLPAITNLI